jgi:hypothetical protein
VEHLEQWGLASVALENQFERDGRVGEDSAGEGGAGGGEVIAAVAVGGEVEQLWAAGEADVDACDGLAEVVQDLAAGEAGGGGAGALGRAGGGEGDEGGEQQRWKYNTREAGDLCCGDRVPRSASGGCGGMRQPGSAWIIGSWGRADRWRGWKRRLPASTGSLVAR